ncbi:hypothetical protein C8F01DRAFT_1209479 [Mycena amicta]|nr:hypothetical protein C8F01DRAFT_1209479 [Mycena amicta]
MPTAKTTAKKKVTKPAPSKKTTSKAATHPSFVEMIKECIIAHPEEARGGVSRPMIKKFIESKYKVEFNAAHASQLSRAITTGSERGTFTLPKGPSGKVKLTPKSSTKENSKPISKAKPATKTTKPSSTKAVAASAKPQPKAKPATASAATRTKKKPAAPKKVLAGKAKGPAAKKPTKKTTTLPSKRAPAKKAVTGAKPAAKAKAVAKKKKTAAAISKV